MAFCIHNDLVPLTGGVFGGVLPAELQNFLYPPPPLLNFTHPVCKTLCMYVGSPLYQIGVVGVVEFSTQDFRRGVAGGSAAIFYHLVGGRDAIFLAFAVLCGRSGRGFLRAKRAIHSLRAISFRALRCYPVCGLPLNPAYLI
jgi:hypothetical protein